MSALLNGPTNPLVTPLLTDMYQISMSYAYWKNGKHNDHSVFDLFFRKNPFKGEYTIFAGLSEALEFCKTYRFSVSDIEYLKEIMPTCEEAFFNWLLELDCSEVKIYAIEEGSIVFPREPLMRVEGPLALVQLLETTLLNLINFPSLIATNACRMKQAAGPGKSLLEFGLRRAQGSDGGICASRYSYLGGFQGSSNVIAGKLFNIPVKGTHAHSFVMSYTSLDDLHTTKIGTKENPAEEVEFLDLVQTKRKLLGFTDTNDGELAAFIAYAQAFPDSNLNLIDTFDTILGAKNFICVGWALHELGYQPAGVRLDSGDLASLSKSVRSLFREVDQIIGQAIFGSCTIVASNDINEDVLLELNKQGHEIDSFGIGTNLVTCQKQPALGCVFKLVEINGLPRIKLSQDIGKLLIPGRKNIYRLYGKDGIALMDFMQAGEEPVPEVGVQILARDPFNHSNRLHVTACEVRSLLTLVYDGGIKPKLMCRSLTLDEARANALKDLETISPDHVRSTDPLKYKVYVSSLLFDFMHELWSTNAPIKELH